MAASCQIIKIQSTFETSDGIKMYYNYLPPDLCLDLGGATGRLKEEGMTLSRASSSTSRGLFKLSA